jgi:hypothetical protein
MGLISLIGVKSTLMFFLRKSKMMGTGFFFLGFIMIIIGWPFFTIIGFCIEMYGIILLFKSFLPNIFMVSQTLPVVGPYIRNSRFIEKFVTFASGDSGSHKRNADLSV